MSFSHAISDSFVALEPVEADQPFEVTMRLKTLEEDGLLMYVANDAADQVV